MSHHPAISTSAFALALLAFAPNTLHAQSDSLTLSAYLHEVERANPGVRAAAAEERAAAARVPSTTRPPDPQLQFGWMNYRLPDAAPMAPLTMRQVQVMQMVPLGGRLRAGRDASRGEHAAATGRSEAARARARLAAASAFFSLQRIDRTLDIARESQRLASDLLAISASMHRAGEAQQADVLRAEVEVERMGAEIERMLAMRAAAAAQLVALVAGPPGSVVGPAATVALPAEVPSIDSLVARAREARPEIRVANASVGQADALERLARSELWPDLSLGAQLADGRDVDGMRESMGSLMVGIALPIFARRRQLQMREEASAMRDATEAERAMLIAETGAEIGMAHAELLRARRLRALYVERLLPAAEAARHSALAAYRAGNVPFMTALDQQMTLNRYREELFQLEADEGVAWAALEALTGLRWLTSGDAAASGVRND